MGYKGMYYRRRSSSLPNAAPVRAHPVRSGRIKKRRLKIAYPLRSTRNPFVLRRGNVIHKMVRFGLTNGGLHSNLITNSLNTEVKGHFSFVPAWIPGIGDLMQQYQYYRINKVTVIFEPCSTEVLMEEADDNTGTNVYTQIPMFYYGRYYGTEPTKNFSSAAAALSSAGCTYSKITKRNYLTFTPNQLSFEYNTPDPNLSPVTNHVYKKWNDTSAAPLSRHFGVRWLVGAEYANTGQYSYRVVVKMSVSFKNARQNITQAIPSGTNAAFDE